MAGSPARAALVVAFLFGVTQPARGEDAECWATVRQEQPRPPPSNKDLASMGLFVAKFVKLIEVTEVYLCIYEGTEIDNNTTEHIISAALARHTVFFMPCDMAKMAEAISAITQGTTTDTGTPSALQQPAALHLLSRATLEPMLDELREASMGWGTLIGLHIILGADLPNCEVFMPKTSCHWYQGSYNMERREVMMDQMFLFGDGREALRVPVVSWDSTKRDLVILHQPGLGPQDFKGHVLNIITITDSPQVMEMRLCDSKNTSLPSASSSFMDRHSCTRFGLNVVGLGKDVVYSGYLVEVILTIAATLNFKIQLSALPPGKDEFGAEMDDGNYSGLIGAIQSQRADIALASFTITNERLRVVDFSGSVGYTGSNLYAQRNSSLEAIGWDTFVLSFHWGTWLAILMLLGIMSTGLWIIVRHQTNEDDHFTKGSNIVFILFSCLVQQGSWILPTTGRVQAVLWLFWVASVVLYASYTAILTSFLTVSTVTPPFTSLEEAVDVPGWKIGLLRGTAVPKIFQRSKKLSYQKVYERLQSDPSLYCESRKEGMDRMITDNKFAFFGDRRAMSYLIRNNCSIKEMTGSYIKSYVHLGFRKLLPYANIINQELLKLEAGGVMDRIYQQWWGKQVPCEAPSPYTQLDFTNILTAFLLLLAGMVTSCVIFALELLYTSQRTDHIPPQVMHDNVEFMIPSRPMKEMAMDNRIFFVRTQGKNRKPWRMTGSERRRL